MERGMKDMLEKIIKAFADQLGIDPEGITGESRIKEDLMADSVDIVELIAELEDEFEIEIPDEELMGFTTVQSVADYLETAVEDK